MNRPSSRARARFIPPCAHAIIATTVLATTGCSDDADEGGFIAGDSGSLEVLAEGLDVPTTVAVRGDTAWVPEGQFNALLSMGMMAPSLPFEVRSVSVDGGLESATIELPGDDFYPEGITAAPNGDLYVGSVFTGQIVKVPADSTTAAVFTPVGVLERGAVGLLVDEARELLWVCDTNLGAADRAGGALVGLSLDDGSEERVRHELPDGSFCNDILIERDGDVLFTETFVGRVYRIDAADALTDDSAEVYIADETIEPPMPGGFGANGLALVGGRLFVAVTSKGTLVRFDPSAADPASTASVVELRDGDDDDVLLSGPDGITRLSDRELLVAANGFFDPSEPSLIKITFDPE